MEKASHARPTEPSLPTPKSTSNRRKSKKRQRNFSREPSTPVATAAATDGSSATKKQKQILPLKGITLSVTTLKDGANSPDDDMKTAQTKDDAIGYSEVCQVCKELGAQVTSQVSKRVQLVLCTRLAVEKATQRVRKAYKKKIPLVDISWLKKCQETGKVVDVEPYSLDDLAKEIITAREKNSVETGGDADADVPNNAGWTEPVSFGCSCVCHENGAEKDCQWCSEGCVA